MTKADTYIDDDGDAKELDEAFFAKAKRGRPSLPSTKRKRRMNVMFDPDVADRLRADGDISKRVNEAMRKELGLTG